MVKLALAIAARVLHREARSIPLLLAGVVRMALEKMADGQHGRVEGAVNEVETVGEIYATQESSRPRVWEDERLSGESACSRQTSARWSLASSSVAGDRKRVLRSDAAEASVMRAHRRSRIRTRQVSLLLSNWRAAGVAMARSRG